jgi:plasmanylethanolamine desaturase
MKISFFIKTPMKTNEEIYENSMLEDDPNNDINVRMDNQPRWGPKNKGAQILANFYSRGKIRILCKFMRR